MMFENVSILGLRGAALSLMLLTYSAAAVAEPGEAESSSGTAGADAEMGAQTIASDSRSKDDSWKDSRYEEDRRKEDRFSFPRWPEHSMPRREIIPPPPPGPYMSTALNRFSLEGPSFDQAEISRPVGRSAVALETADTRATEFSPDMPWPDDPGSNNSSPLKRWQPEKGYHFVDEAEKPGSAAPEYYTQPQYLYGYQYPAPSYMGWPGNSWMPAMYSAPSYHAPYGLMPGRYYATQPYQQGTAGVAAPAK